MARVMSEVLRNTPNDFNLENYDADRFGPRGGRSLKNRILRSVVQVTSSGKLAVVPVDDTEDRASRLAGMYATIEESSFLYDSLADDYSKDLLVQLMAFRILGWRKVKLPTNNPRYWEQKQQADGLANHKDTIQSKFLGWKLPRFDLKSIGWPVDMYYSANGVLKTFLVKQYEYNHRQPAIRVQPGDTAIDGGGCWGDTALYFAHLAGATGRVFTFEFLPSNLEILNRNLGQNPELASRISIIPHPLFNVSGKELTFQENGPGTRVSESQGAAGSTTAVTAAIDDVVRDKQIARVGFIKMDIEGAELAALQGSVNTLKRDRPRLAIALYHDLRDFVTIPRFLASLNLGYRFHLDHFTIHAEETILFAEPTP